MAMLNNQRVGDFLKIGAWKWPNFTWPKRREKKKNMFDSPCGPARLANLQSTFTETSQFLVWDGFLEQ